MIPVKSESDILKMRGVCKIAAGVLKHIEPLIRPGVSTAEINAAAEEYILNAGAKPNFKNYNGFPAAACISVNDTVVHGIPSPSAILKEGDIVSVDLGAVKDGFHSDAARTYPVGNVSPARKRLVDAAEESFFEGLRFARPGRRIGDISNAVQRCVEARGFSVVRAMVGHGIGRSLHEEPTIPNFGAPGQGPLIKAGYCLAIEPMINAGGFAVVIDPDGWTCRTKDGSDSAHYENTVLITHSGAEILTL
ncbi:MAG: type I methionyl aminopeptidase [Clostridiales bacterium]|jgi:methionyl aminopeptidase|nr:type I methionyl aminopeptidase [Clostridiales bacterium]